ncbi:MAG: hypothetical protein ACYDEB_01365 [Dehalococcoidia bacterium]
MTVILSAPSPIVPALFVALFAVGTLWAYDIARRAMATRPRSAAHSVGGAVRAAADEARASLAALSSDEEPEAVYTRLAVIMRAYLDARFGLRTQSMPGAEIERAIARAGGGRAAARLAAHLLERCAHVQAAAIRPEPERIAADLRSAREVIDLFA